MQDKSKQLDEGILSSIDCLLDSIFEVADKCGRSKERTHIIDDTNAIALLQNLRKDAMNSVKSDVSDQHYVLDSCTTTQDSCLDSNNLCDRLDRSLIQVCFLLITVFAHYFIVNGGHCGTTGILSVSMWTNFITLASITITDVLLDLEERGMLNQ